MRLFAILLTPLIAICFGFSSAFAIETKARQAILVDATTGTVLLEKDADVLVPPASMTKLMTVYLAFEALKEGRMKMDDLLSVSERAWKMGGSKMFVLVKDQIAVADLLRGIIVQSGNDACVVIAEALSGSEEAFAEKMTEKAREIGLMEATFKNSTGWPAVGHEMSARELAQLSARLIGDFPEYYPIFSEREFTYADIKQANRNPLLFADIGADGLKTGHTEASGYGLTASAVQGNRRLILVLNGMGSIKERSEESKRLLSWGFREFAALDMFKAGDEVEKAEVWTGSAPTVSLVLEQDLTVTIPRGTAKKLKVTAVYDGPITAPISAGQKLGVLRIEMPGDEIPPIERSLVAATGVAKAGLMGRTKSAFLYGWRMAFTE